MHGVFAPGSSQEVKKHAPRKIKCNEVENHQHSYSQSSQNLAKLKYVIDE